MSFVVTSTRDSHRANIYHHPLNSGRRERRPPLAPAPSEEISIHKKYSLHLHPCNPNLISGIPFHLTLSPTDPLTNENLSDLFAHVGTLMSLSIQNSMPIFSTAETSTGFFWRSRPTLYV